MQQQPQASISTLVLDNMSIALLLLDSHLHIRYLNTSAEQLLAHSAKRALGEHLPNLFQKTSLDPRMLKEVVTSGHSFSIAEASVLLHDETELKVDLNASPLKMGAQTFALLEIKSVDKQRRISQEIYQTAQQQAARELVRGLAHEIKNPLGGLRGAAQLLEKQLTDDSLKEFTQIIISQADRLTNLVNRLLGPQKVGQSGKHNIHQVLEAVRQLVILELPETISLERDYDPSLPDMAMDPEQLQQAILNVVINAKEALSGKGNIRLVTRAASNVTLGGKRHRLCIEVRIIDNGPGIPQHLQDTLFYPMVTGKLNGSGLGLSIAQTLIHQHGGRIECHSRPGHTEFRISLPIHKD